MKLFFFNPRNRLCTSGFYVYNDECLRFEKSLSFEIQHTVSLFMRMAIFSSHQAMTLLQRRSCWKRILVKGILTGSGNQKSWTEQLGSLFSLPVFSMANRWPNPFHLHAMSPIAEATYHVLVKIYTCFTQAVLPNPTGYFSRVSHGNRHIRMTLGRLATNVHASFALLHCL